MKHKADRDESVFSLIYLANDLSNLLCSDRQETMPTVMKGNPQWNKLYVSSCWSHLLGDLLVLSFSYSLSIKEDVIVV